MPTPLARTPTPTAPHASNQQPRAGPSKAWRRMPYAARVVQKVGQEEDPSNFLLMHAMGPNVAGVIGSAIAAGVLLNFFG